METTREDIFDRIMGLPGLRILKPWYSKHKEVLLYLFFGGLAVFLNLGLFVFFTKNLGWGDLFANVIDWVICVLFQFITNKTWVFDAGTDSTKGLVAQLAGFFGGRLLTLLLEELILGIFIVSLHWNRIGVKLAAQIFVIVSNYVISKFFVFKKKS
nr:GtrA family protein [uncultured Stomatobaculum sp.]